MHREVRDSGPGSIAAFCAFAAIVQAASAGDLDPSGQAGQYESVVAPVLRKGSGGVFLDSTIWVPFLLLNDSTAANPRQALIWGAAVEQVGAIPIGAVGTFGGGNTNPNPDRVLAVLGTTDAAGGGFSNNVMLRETANAGNSVGSLLPDGTLVFREVFADIVSLPIGQNNLGLLAGITGIAPQTVTPSAVPAEHVFNTTAVNLGDAAESAINPDSNDVHGEMRIGVPSAVRDPNVQSPANSNDLLTAVTQSNGLVTPPIGEVPATIEGVVVYRGRANDPRAGGAGCWLDPGDAGAPGPAHVASWLLCDVPLPSSPSGTPLSSARQSKPVMEVVQTPSGAPVIYVAHAIGFSNVSAIGGGAARPVYIAVDTITNPDGTPRLGYRGGDPVLENNTILIEADAAGPEGSQHGRPFAGNAEPGFVALGYADHFNTNADKRFVDSIATAGTGASVGPNTPTRFDLNRAGQIVVVWEDRSQSPMRFEVRLYDPLWNAGGTRIGGYVLSRVITFSGDTDNDGAPLVVDRLRTTIANPADANRPNLESTLVPFSGVAIDDGGRVAFVAATEKLETPGDWDNNPSTPSTFLLRDLTSDLFVWEPTTGTLHSLLRGGQNGDNLLDAFPGSGPATNELLALGAFPVDANPDALSREGFSRSGGLIAIPFRSCLTQFTGGVRQDYNKLPDPDDSGPSPAPTDTFIHRGGSLYQAGQLGSNERSVRGVAIVRLGAFGSAAPCCPGNAGKSPGSTVNFGQILVVLANFGAPANPNGTSSGDANCDGFVNFLDILVVLAEFGSVCP